MLMRVRETVGRGSRQWRSGLGDDGERDERRVGRRARPPGCALMEVGSGRLEIGQRARGQRRSDVYGHPAWAAALATRECQKERMDFEQRVPKLYFQRRVPSRAVIRHEPSVLRVVVAAAVAPQDGVAALLSWRIVEPHSE